MIAVAVGLASVCTAGGGAMAGAGGGGEGGAGCLAGAGGGLVTAAGGPGVGLLKVDVGVDTVVGYSFSCISRCTSSPFLEIHLILDLVYSWVQPWEQRL